MNAKRAARTALKLAVTALLLFLLYRKVDGRGFSQALRGLRWAWVPAFFAIAERVMARRGIALTDADREIFTAIYNISDRYK